MSEPSIDQAVAEVASHPGMPEVALRHGRERRIYRHSNIFVLVACVADIAMAALTYPEGSRVAIVPRDAVYDEPSHSIVLPIATRHPRVDGPEIGELSAQSKNLGVVFTITLLLVVFITNTPLRGMWSAIAVLLVAVLTVTCAWLGLWPEILSYFGTICARCTTKALALVNPPGSGIVPILPRALPAAIWTARQSARPKARPMLGRKFISRSSGGGASTQRQGNAVITGTLSPGPATILAV